MTPVCIDCFNVHGICMYWLLSCMWSMSVLIVLVSMTSECIDCFSVYHLCMCWLFCLYDLCIYWLFYCIWPLYVYIDCLFQIIRLCMFVHCMLHSRLVNNLKCLAHLLRCVLLSIHYWHWFFFALLYSTAFHSVILFTILYIYINND